jgi:hypothetical protein
VKEIRFFSSEVRSCELFDGGGVLRGVASLLQPLLLVREAGGLLAQL